MAVTDFRFATGRNNIVRERPYRLGSAAFSTRATIFPVSVSISPQQDDVIPSLATTSNRLGPGMYNAQATVGVFARPTASLGATYTITAIIEERTSGTRATATVDIVLLAGVVVDAWDQNRIVADGRTGMFPNAFPAPTGGDGSYTYSFLDRPTGLGLTAGSNRIINWSIESGLPINSYPINITVTDGAGNTTRVPFTFGLPDLVVTGMLPGTITAGETTGMIAMPVPSMGNFHYDYDVTVTPTGSGNTIATTVDAANNQLEWSIQNSIPDDYSLMLDISSGGQTESFNTLIVIPALSLGNFPQSRVTLNRRTGTIQAPQASGANYDYVYTVTSDSSDFTVSYNEATGFIEYEIGEIGTYNITFTVRNTLTPPQSFTRTLEVLAPAVTLSLDNFVETSYNPVGRTGTIEAPAVNGGDYNYTFAVTSSDSDKVAVSYDDTTKLITYTLANTADVGDYTITFSATSTGNTVSTTTTLSIIAPTLTNFAQLTYVLEELTGTIPAPVASEGNFYYTYAVSASSDSITTSYDQATGLISYTLGSGTTIDTHTLTFSVTSAAAMTSKTTMLDVRTAPFALAPFAESSYDSVGLTGSIPLPAVIGGVAPYRYLATTTDSNIALAVDLTNNEIDYTLTVGVMPGSHVITLAVSDSADTPNRATQTVTLNVPVIYGYPFNTDHGDGSVIRGMTYNEYLYVLDNLVGTRYLERIETDGDRTRVYRATTNLGIIADIAFDGSNYYLVNTARNLYRLPANFSSITLIGSTGSTQFRAMAWDSTGSALYASDGDGNIFTINRTSGVATSLNRRLRTAGSVLALAVVNGNFYAIDTRSILYTVSASNVTSEVANLSATIGTFTNDDIIRGMTTDGTRIIVLVEHEDSGDRGQDVHTIYRFNTDGSVAST